MWAKRSQTERLADLLHGGHREKYNIWTFRRNSFISVAELVPFLKTTTRTALMGSNSRRQSVSLLRAVGTGMEAVAARGIQAPVVIAKRNGVVDYVDSERIDIIQPTASD